MKMMKLLIFCLIIVSIATSVMADKTLFDCSIKRNKTLSPDGLVVTSFDDLKTELENKKLNGDLDSMVTKYPSASETDRQVFKGQFKCNDSQLVIAVLSDDGVTVKVTNADTEIPTNVAFYEQGQALPNLDSSLKLVNGSWTDDTTYNVEIDYSNTCYTGNGDIDGLTLYFCGDVELIPNPDPIVPDAGISISFPKSTYNIGESTEANLTIYGKTNNANIMATVTGLGISQTIVDVSSGYGAATVNIPTYSSPNTYVYTATATINGITVSNTTFINVISNTAPIVTNATAVTNEDTPTIPPIPLTATDPDGDTLTYSIDNPYTYTPPQDFNGVDTVTFTVDDGRGGISTGTITVTVNPINDVAVAYDGYFDTDEDTETTIYYPGYDVDGDIVTPIIIGGPAHGTLGNYDSLTNSVSYTPATNYNGTDTIKFLLNDGLSDSNEATISINVKPVGDNISITTGKYLYANGVDSCIVSIVGSPNTAVTLSTTGGTLSDTALTTDDQGQASVTLTSSVTSGEVTITASMLGDDALVTVTFFTFDLQPANCIPVPNSDIFASPIGKTGEKVNVNVVTTPVIDLLDTSLGFTFTGGIAGTTNDFHTVAKDIAEVTTLTASMRGVSKTCDVAVIKVTEIVADSTIISVFIDNTFSLNEKQAVSSWTATPNSSAVLKVNVEPEIDAIHEIFDKLFVWSGGQAGDTIDKRIISRNSPSKTKISIKCGESSDAVVAWIAKVNIDIANIRDSIEDTPAGIATIYPNTDDDNNTATTDYDGSDLDESIVIGENDLVPISLSVEPAGIGGKFMLNKTSATKLQVRCNADKSGTVSSILCWMIPTDPNSTEIMPQLLYLEGQEVSDDDGDQIIKAEYYWGEYKLDLYCEDTVKATVKPRDGDSEVSICVFNPAKNSQGVNIPGVEKYSPIGGKMFVGLKIKVGPGERLATALQSMTVKIQDDYSYVGDPAFARYTFDLTTTSNWFELKNAGTAFQKWEPAVIAPNDLNGNKNGSSARVFCKIFEWDTSFTPSLNFTPPMGHNGAHTLEIVKINGQDGNKALFQRFNNGWQTAYEKEVQAQKAVVKNLVVTNVSTSNGTEDYFKYNPVPGSPYNRPVINFTIEDEGDPHEYDAYILMWPTSITADVFSRLTTSDAVAWDMSYHLGTGAISKTWDGSLISSQWAGHEADQADWGTYAFEICVYEYPDSNTKVEDFTDWFYLRWPYCLQIDEHGLVNINSGEYIDYVDNLTGKTIKLPLSPVMQEMRYYYKLKDYADLKSYNVYNNKRIINITVIDNKMDELCPTETPNNLNDINVMHNGDNSNGLLAVSKDYRGNFNHYIGWRVIFTGVDNCWTGYRRDHQETRVLATNTSYPGGYPMSDDDLQKILILSICLYNIMQNEENASDVMIHHTVFIPPGSSTYIFTKQPTPERVRLSLKKYIVMDAARNAYLTLQTPLSDRRKITKFLDDRYNVMGWLDGTYAQTLWDIDKLDDNSWCLFFRGVNGFNVGQHKYKFKSFFDSGAENYIEVFIHELLHVGLVPDAASKNAMYCIADAGWGSYNEPFNFDAPNILNMKTDNTLTYRATTEIFKRLSNVINQRKENEPYNEHMLDIYEMFNRYKLDDKNERLKFINKWVTPVNQLDNWVK
jgi:hypothetical protein